MKPFDPEILIPKRGKLLSELFPRPNENTVLLLWKISISLRDFTLGNYPVFDSMIELGSFTLPYFSLHSAAQHPPQLKSWKELPFKKYDFRNSHIDNIGSIYYNIPYRSLGQGYGTDEGTLFFDNIVDIEEIEFGEFHGSDISSRVVLQIDFDAFNIHDPPFSKDWYCERFEMNLNLKIENVMIQSGVREINASEARAIGSQALNIDDYDLISERKMVFINAKDSEERTMHFFRPKLTNQV